MHIKSNDLVTRLVTRQLYYSEEGDFDSELPDFKRGFKPVPQTAKLSIEKIKSLAYTKEAVTDPKSGVKSYPKDIWWDTDTKGFGVRVFPTGTKSYIYKYRNEAGQQKFLTIGDTGEISLKEARARAKKHAVGVIDGADPVKERRRAKTDTYLQFLDHTYYQHLVAHLRGGVDNAENVRETMATLKRTFPEFHDLQLKEITPFLIEKWRQRRIGEGVKPSSINRQMNDLRACLNKAVKWGALEVSPFEKVEPTKTDRNQLVRYLTDEEEALLRSRLDAREARMKEARENANIWRDKRGYDSYADLKDREFADHLKPAVLLSLNTGLRRGELLGLRWSDVDLERRNLTVRGEGAKSGQTRHVPLNEEAQQVLKAWKEQPGLKGLLVFHGRNGVQLQNLRKSWQSVLDETPNRIENFRWHDMRHTFASKLVMAGVDLNTVRELMGHSDYKMTLRYAHLAPQVKAEAVSRLVAQSRRSR